MLDYVKADRFYQDNADKIKLNWLCYEYANSLYSAVCDSARLFKYRKSRTDAEIADFCLYLSKRIRKSIFDKLTGAMDTVMFRTSYVREFYSGMRVRQMDAILEVAISVWEKQLQGCIVCPNQCLKAGFDLTDMFDNLAQTGWPTR
jgi:hypothetical protein